MAAQTIEASGFEPAWLNFEQGKRAFSDKNFGSALVFFESAIESRRKEFVTASAKLEQIRALKQAKDGSIKNTLAAFAKEDFIQRDYAALVKGREPFSRELLLDLKKERISDSHRSFLDVLLAVGEYYPLSKLNDSIAELSRRVFLLVSFPEAEYWKGRLFFIEGELSLAENQYERAFSKAESLDIKEEQYTFLYALAEVYEVRGNWTAWESVLLKIANSLDISIDSYLKRAMENTLLESGFDHFMTLYRFEPSYSLLANAKLAAYYIENGRAQALLHGAIAVNMILSKAIRMINEKDSDYTWQGLEDFMKRSNSERVQNYLEENNFLNCMLCFADSLYVAGARAPAIHLWRNIAITNKKPQSVTALQRLAAPASAIRQALDQGL